MQAKYLRETDLAAPYTYKMDIKATRRVPGFEQSFSATQSLTLKLFVTASASAANSTFIDTAGAELANNADEGADAAACACSNECSDANDGYCDDAGPGSDYGLCAFASDCADCGPRQASSSQTAAFVQFAAQGNYSGYSKFVDHVVGSNTSQAQAAQLEACIPTATARAFYHEFACPASHADTDCRKLGLNSEKSRCQMRDSRDWQSASSVPDASVRCRLKFGEAFAALQISPRGCGNDGGLGCFICCDGLPDQESVATTTLRADELYDGQASVGKRTFDLGNVTVGAFNPRFKWGRVFQFVIRDVDGLPVVAESYRGVQRISTFRYEVEREGSQDKAQPLTGTLLSTTQADGRLPRSMQGRVEVVVSIQHVGPHRVLLYGPSLGARFELLPWDITLNGVCPQDNVVMPDGTCGCGLGLEMNSSLLCQPCRSGFVRDNVLDDQCTACPTLQTDKFSPYVSKDGDPHRRETRDVMMPELNHRYLHDELSDCGCSTNFYMDFASVDIKAQRDACPSQTNLEAWNQPKHRALRHRLAAQCCSDASTVASSSLHAPADLCSTPADWACMERLCRADFIQRHVLPIEVDSTERATCRSCLQRPMECPTPFTTVHTMIVKPGFWRSSELSSIFLECKPNHCIGTINSTSSPLSTRRLSESRVAVNGTFGIDGLELNWDVAQTLTEDLCQPGHWGPLCATCAPYHFKDASGVCTIW